MLTLGNILVGIMAMLFVATCLFMMLVILIQKPKGGGLSGAFGGAGGSAQAAFGAKTGDLLTTITIACFVLFLGLAVGLVYAIRAEVAPVTPAPTTPVSAPADTETTGGTAPDTTEDATEDTGEPTPPQAENDTAPAAETDAGDTPQAPDQTPVTDAQP